MAYWSSIPQNLLGTTAGTEALASQAINRSRLTSKPQPTIEELMNSSIQSESTDDLINDLAGGPPGTPQIDVEQPQIQQPVNVPPPMMGRPVPGISRPSQQSGMPAPMQIPGSVSRDAKIASFLAQLSNLGAVTGQHPRGNVDPLAPLRAEQAVRGQWLEEQQALQALRPKQQQMNPLQQLQYEKGISELESSKAQRDPDSRESRAMRASIMELYPEFYGSSDKDFWDDLSYAEMQNPMFQKSIESFYSKEEKQGESDITLQRQKDFADYTKQLELQKAALASGNIAEARRIAGEQRVERGGDEDRMEGIRNLILSSFPPGSLEERPHIKRAVMDLEGDAFKRGSMNAELTNRLNGLVARVEKDMSYNLPGWKRVEDSNAPELSQQEVKEARAALSAEEEVQAAMKRLRKIKNSLDLSDFVKAQIGYKTQNMADALAIQEQLFNNLRIVGNYGVPQEAELRRMEKQLPSFDSLNGLINGMRLADAMNKSIMEKVNARLRTNGWVKDNKINRIDGTTIEEVK